MDISTACLCLLTIRGPGIARRLVEKLLSDAVENGIEQITSDATITVKPFFERKGFNIVHEQSMMPANLARANVFKYVHESALLLLCLLYSTRAMRFVTQSRVK
jgi:N-acetylglutamate synthase-like GNAT family acetyltransferase